MHVLAAIRQEQRASIRWRACESHRISKRFVCGGGITGHVRFHIWTHHVPLIVAGGASIALMPQLTARLKPQI